MSKSKKDSGVAQEEITVAGISLLAPAPYSEGSVLTTAEAGVLNQTLKENLRNNFAKTVKDAITEVGGDVESVDADELQNKFNAYIETYKFGVRRSVLRILIDPVEKEARKQATAIIVAALRNKGKARKDVDKEAFANAVTAFLESEQGATIRETAKQNVEARNAISEETLDSLAL